MPDMINMAILKVAGRCNLNCSYCYEFNLADHGLKQGPRFMSDAVFTATLHRLKDAAESQGQTRVGLSFHGGEPCLIGWRKFAAWCEQARSHMRPLDLRISIQTNGTLLSPEWAKVFLDNDVDVGVSIDGTPDVHDRARVNHVGKGSYAAVRRGIELMIAENVRFGVLNVIPLGADPIVIHRHLVDDLGCRSINYLMPDVTHETVKPLHSEFGPTPCADFLIPIFDDWWFNSTLNIRIRIFWEMARLILGGKSHLDAFGNIPLGFVVVNPAGDIQGLDVLKACGDGIVDTGLNALTDDFGRLRAASPLHAQMIFDGPPLPDGCRGCPEQFTCSGGYHPHRYSPQRQFNNPSAWCADLLKIFAHMRHRLEVDPAETSRLRDELENRAAVAA